MTIRAILLIWAILPFSSAVNAVNYYYPTGSFHDALNACYAEQTLDNHYYCLASIRTALLVSGGNTYIGHFYSYDKSGAVKNSYSFGWSGTVKPASYECLPTSSYSASTGLCSSYSQTPQFCNPSLNGFGIGAVDESYIAGQGCQWDNDSDGKLQYQDNCQLVSNPDQSDLDADGIGDLCDGCNPDEFTASYSAEGDSIATNLPSSYCSSALCTMSLNISNCTSGTCNISYNSTGAQCSASNQLDLSKYVLQSPASYGFNLEADNASFLLQNGFLTIVGLNQSQKFKITNCVYSPTGSGVNNEWNSYNTQGCPSFDYLNRCSTPSELDTYLQSYVVAHPRYSTVANVGAGQQYGYWKIGTIQRGAYSTVGTSIPDLNLGSDDGNGTYTATVLISDSGFKYFEPNNNQFPYREQSDGTAHPFKLSLEGCTGGVGSGGSSGGSVSGTVSVSELAETHSDITPSIQGLMTEQVDHLTEFMEKANAAGEELTDLFGAEQGDTEQSCIDPNGGQPTNCPNEDRQSPDFFDSFESIFEPSSTCPDLTAEFGGASVNLISQFCTMWEQYGRPIFSFIIYWLTLLGIRDIWLGSSPKPR